MITVGATVQALESGAAMLCTVSHSLRVPTRKTVQDQEAADVERLHKKPKMNGIGEKLSSVKILNNEARMY